jgi:hypothetical protein
MPPKHTIEIVNTLQVLVAAMVAMTDGKLPDMMEAAKVQKLEKKEASEAPKPPEAPEASSEAGGVEAQPGSEPEPSVEGTAAGSGYDCHASVCSSTAISVDECKRMTEQARPAPQISPELQSAWQQCEALQAELAAMSVPLAAAKPAAVAEPGAAEAEDGKGARDSFLDRNRSFEQPESEHTPTSGGVQQHVPSFRLPAVAPGVPGAPGGADKAAAPSILPPIEELRSEKKPDTLEKAYSEQLWESATYE